MEQCLTSHDDPIPPKRGIIPDSWQSGGVDCFSLPSYYTLRNSVYSTCAIIRSMTQTIHLSIRYVVSFINVIENTLEEMRITHLEN